MKQFWTITQPTIATTQAIEPDFKYLNSVVYCTRRSR
jgi:hypothetical protein